MKISIIGLGWFGKALAGELKAHHQILGTTRTEDKLQIFKDQNILAERLTATDLPSDKLLSADVIVLNIPPFSGQLEWLKKWNWHKQAHVIFISSTSVYGNSGFLDEQTVPLPETENGKILQEEEKWFKSFPLATIVRFGGLIGSDRHPGRILSGRTNIAGGNLPVNLIHLKDCIGFTKLLIDRKLVNETFNLVDPQHPSRQDYYQAYCRKNNLPLPEFTESSDPGKVISSEKAGKIYQFSNLLD